MCGTEWQSVPIKIYGQGCFQNFYLFKMRPAQIRYADYGGQAPIMKAEKIFVCAKCDAQFQKWTGRCLECGGWGTLQAAALQQVKAAEIKNKKSLAPAGKTVGFDQIIGQESQRLTTGWGEIDRVLGGGLAPGALALLGGEPGIGKSTLVLQLLESVAQKSKGRLLYASGEESAEQVKSRFDRLKLAPRSLEFLAETGVETICATIEELKPALAVVDSLQTLTTVESAPRGQNFIIGSPAQLKIVTAKLTEVAKSTGVPIILIGHVTKEGELSGPKTLEHLVDVVLYLEGDRFHEYRLLRAVKNRFGSTDEVGVLEMTGDGLREVKNPSAAFLSGRAKEVTGSAVTCLAQGTRPMLVEVQALVSRTQFGYPQRRASGFDLNRLQVLIGVLTKRADLPLDSYDVFLNVVGGLRANEPAADLAVVLALASAFKNKVIPANLAAFGEVGLGGEVRAVTQTERRLQEIKKMGFEFAVTPPDTGQLKVGGLKIAPVSNVREIVEKIVR